MAVSDSPSASKLIIGGNPQIKQIAVTFDAGPDSMPAPRPTRRIGKTPDTSHLFPDRPMGGEISTAGC